MTDNLERINARITVVEEKVNLLERHNAVENVHRENVEKRLSSIEGYLNRLIWLILTSLGTALMAFLLRGTF